MPRLEYLIHPKGQTQRIDLKPLPFILGRETSAHFTVQSASVSKAHAEIYEYEGHFWIRDLGSSNGTFVAGQAIREAPLENGDVILLAKSEFQFFFNDRDIGEGIPETVPITDKDPVSVMQLRPLFQEMLQSQAIRIIFQPIVDLHTRKTIGVEALGRGRFRALSPKPAELFKMAKLCTMAGDLSRAFRLAAINESHTLPAGQFIFCNLHPDEFTRLLPVNMEQFLPNVPKDRKLILEVPEDAVDDVTLLRDLRDQLRSRGVGMAFDDFGKGQARLSVLADAPPDFIKLDIRLVRDIHREPGRREVVRAICDAAQALNVTVIAEGLEKQGELESCKDLGCQLGQGYLLGHPEYMARA
jgi:EAL domain-containing protein (putative c-di-GMP-specific phosphodiesterase class I)